MADGLPMSGIGMGMHPAADAPPTCLVRHPLGEPASSDRIGPPRASRTVRVVYVPVPVPSPRTPPRSTIFRADSPRSDLSVARAPYPYGSTQGGSVGVPSQRRVKSP